MDGQWARTRMTPPLTFRDDFNQQTAFLNLQGQYVRIIVEFLDLWCFLLVVSCKLLGYSGGTTFTLFFSKTERATTTTTTTVG
jgi:hypothetical protein